MRFWWLCLCAYVRGLVWKWPRRPPVEGDYSGVSAALRNLTECREAYLTSGWEPFCFHRATDGATTRLFRVPLTDEGKEHRRIEDEYWRLQTEPATPCEEPGCGATAEGHCAACSSPRCHRHLYRSTQSDGDPTDLCLDCTEPSVHAGDDWFVP